MDARENLSLYPSMRRAVITLVILFAAYIFSYIDRQILSLLVGPIRADLGISDLQMGLLQGFAFAIFFCFCGIPLGYVADHANRKLVVAAGIFGWSLMTVLCGFAGSFAALFLFRMGVGVGEAALAPAVYSILADSFPRTKLVRATSVMAQGPVLGAGMSLLLGGQIIAYIDRAPAAPFGLVGFHPWQVAFIAVGAPGFLLAAIVLLIREPVRQGSLGAVKLRFGEAVAGLWARRRDYAPFYLSGVSLSIVNFAAMTWFPTHLIRTFGITPGTAGGILGLVHVTGGIVGAIGGAALTEALLRRGHPAAYLLTVMTVALLLIVSMVAPFMPTLNATVAVWLFSVTLQSAYSGSIYAAVNLITPNQMRAFNTSLIVLCANLFGLALGSALIGGLARPLFGDQPAALGKTIAIVGAAAASFAAFAAWRGLPRLRALLAAEGAETLAEPLSTALDEPIRLPA